MPFNRERLKSRRVDMGITLQEVADIIGVEKPTVQRYESGKINKIDTITVEKLASAIKCSPAYLMGWQSTPQIDQENNFNLNAHEKELIHNYRAMNEEGQEKVVGYISDLVETGRYKKLDKFCMGNEEKAKQA